MPYAIGFISPLIFYASAYFLHSIMGGVAVLIISGILLGWNNKKSFSRYAIGAIAFGVTALVVIFFVSSAKATLGDVLSSFFVPSVMCIFGFIGIKIGSLFHHMLRQKQA